MPNHFTYIVFWCERCDLLCSHSNGDIFTCEDNMLFSRVKISSFTQKLAWYFIGVYIVKGNITHLNTLFPVFDLSLQRLHNSDETNSI